MKRVIETIAGMLFYVFAVGVLLWTASLTYQEVASLFPGDPITPIFALCLFDGGALAWLASFIYKAKGMQQRATALLMTVADLAGVVLMAAGYIFTGGQTIADIPQWLGDAVVYGLIGATLLNVAAVYFYHLYEPATQEAIEMQSLEDGLQAEALKQARVNIEREAQQLGALMAARTTSRIKYRLRLPMSEQEATEWQGEIVDGQPEEVTPESPFFGQGGEPITTLPSSDLPSEQSAENE